jgi:hypothetical protein
MIAVQATLASTSRCLSHDEDPQAIGFATGDAHRASVSLLGTTVQNTESGWPSGWASRRSMGRNVSWFLGVWTCIFSPAGRNRAGTSTVVVRPESALSVSPGERVTLHASVPVWNATAATYER